jgi:hypothetical protein
MITVNLVSIDELVTFAISKRYKSKKDRSLPKNRIRVLDNLDLDIETILQNPGIDYNIKKVQKSLAKAIQEEESTFLWTTLIAYMRKHKITDLRLMNIC